MKTIQETNKQLLRVLGLDRLNGITAVDIAMRANALPAITVQLSPAMASNPATLQFRLIAPLQGKAPQFNLDALCEAAKHNIRNTIEMAARRHIVELGFGYGRGGYISRASKQTKQKVMQDGRATWRTVP